MRHTFIYYLGLLVLVCMLNGCKTIQAESPTLQPQRVPPPPISLSQLSLPIDIDLSPYFVIADKQVDTRFTGSDDPCEGVAYNYYFERDPLKFAGNGAEVSTHVKGRYKIHMSYCPGCTDAFSKEPVCLSPRVSFSCGVNEPLRKIELSFISSFTLTPEYALKTTTRIGDIRPLDPCEVTLFRFDATDKLIAEIRKSLGTLAADIDKQTARITFKAEATQAWNMMSHSIPVKNFGYLNLNPDRIRITQPKITGTQLSATLHLLARPTFTSIPDTFVQSKLPQLQISNEPLSDTLEVTSDIILDYDSLSLRLTEQLRGQEFVMKGNRIQFTEVRIKGARDANLVFEVAFDGDKRGRIFVTGQPVLDPVNDVVWLANTDFDLETKNLLLKSAKWLFSDKILDAISAASKQDLKPQTKALLSSVNSALNYEVNGFRISGKVNSLKLQHLYAGESRLTVRVNARARLRLTNLRN